MSQHTSPLDSEADLVPANAANRRPAAGNRNVTPAVDVSWVGPQVKELASAMAGTDFEAARQAHQKLANLVHRAGRPGAAAERRACSEALVVALATGHQEQVQRQLLWLISEVSGDEAVGPVAEYLHHEGLRDDARMVLQRIPGFRSLKALQTAMGKVPTEFRRAIVVSLRARGVAVQGLPSRKLTPSRPTRVKALT